MSKTEFRQVDLDALGYPKGDIRDWLDAGHIKASIKQADGVGTRNVYSRDDVLRIIALRALVRVGFNVKLAVKILDEREVYLNGGYPWIDTPGTDNPPIKKRALLEDLVGGRVLLGIGVIHYIKESMLAWSAGVRGKSYEY